MEKLLVFAICFAAPLVTVSATAAAGANILDLVRQSDGTLPALPPGCEDVDQEAMWHAIVQRVANGKNSNDEIALAAMLTCKLHGAARAGYQALPSTFMPVPQPVAKQTSATFLAPTTGPRERAVSPPASFEVVDANPRSVDAIAAPSPSSQLGESLVSDEGYNRHGGAWMNPDGHVVVKACATPTQARRWATGEGKDPSCRLLDLSADGYVSIQKDAVEEGDLGPTYDLIRAKDDAMLYADSRWRG